MEYSDRIKFCKKCKNKKVIWGEGIHCALTNQKPDFENVCDYFEVDENIERLEKEKEQLFLLAQLGRKKLFKLLLFLVLISISTALFSFMTYRELDDLNVVKVTGRISAEIFIYYMIYLGKSWAKRLVTILLGLGILFSVLTIVPLVHKYPTILILLILPSIYAYVLYKLYKDTEINAFLKYQEQNA